MPLVEIHSRIHEEKRDEWYRLIRRKYGRIKGKLPEALEEAVTDHIAKLSAAEPSSPQHRRPRGRREFVERILRPALERKISRNLEHYEFARTSGKVYWSHRFVERAVIEVALLEVQQSAPSDPRTCQAYIRELVRQGFFEQSVL